uniref:Protein kinase essential for the initiation of dna replication dna replication n=1 Tax=Amblyomma aureolatum TaxID=187763 RepID=A0A1E1X8T0_9ACAR
MTFKVGDYGWVWDGIQWTSWRSLNSDRDQQKPLLGSTLFIWIKRLKLDESELLRNIQVLGGRVSKFLDEAVSFVVTDQDPTKVAAPQKPPGEPLTRGQLILSRAHKSAEAGAAEDCVIDRVREARIRLWNISQFLRWVEVHLNIQPAPASEPASSRKRKSSRLPRPLIKVEDVEQQFKPVYKVFKSDPALYVNPLYPSSPFDDPAVQERYVQLKKSGKVSSCDSDVSEKEPALTAPANKPQQGTTPAAAAPPAKHQYCECCNAYFFNLQQHIGPDGEHHREFALREDNFECVKELIDCFPTLDDFVVNGDHGVDKALSDMHPSAYHFAMLNAAGMQASAAAYHRPPPVPFPTRPGFDPSQVMVKQEPQDDSPPSTVHHSGLLSGVGEASAAVPLDFSRTSQLTEICGQSFPREYVHHHHQGPPPPPLIPHPPYLPDKSEEPQSCWMAGGGAKMDSSSGQAAAAAMPPPAPHLSHHSQGAPVSSSHHLPLENLSFLDPPQQDAMFTSELPQPDFSFGLQNLLHSICDEAEDESSQRRSGGSRGIESHKENLEKVAENAAAPTSLVLQPEQHQQQFPAWPYSEPASMVEENTRCQQQPSMENSSSSPLELTAHTPSEAPLSSASKQTAARRRHSRDDEDATSNGMSESNPNRWTVERTRRGVGLKLKFTPARKQSSSLMSPPTPAHTPRTPKAAKSGGGGSSSFDVYDWNEEEEGECSDFVKVQWRVMHTEDTKVILCRTKQFALPRKHGKGVGGGKQLVY